MFPSRHTHIAASIVADTFKNFRSITGGGFPAIVVLEKTVIFCSISLAYIESLVLSLRPPVIGVKDGVDHPVSSVRSQTADYELAGGVQEGGASTTLTKEMVE